LPSFNDFIGTRRGIECLYLVKVPAGLQARSPTQPSLSVPDDCNDLQPMPCIQQLSEGPHYSAKHLLDLRLMHHYSVFASEYFTRKFPEKVSIELKVNIPRLALEHDFLMDALLLVSMIHLGCTNPISLESLPVYLYRDQALRALRKAVADISQQTIDAVRGASVLLATVSFATDRVTRQPGLWAANWLTHVVGQRNFRTSASHRQKSTLSYTQDGMESPSHDSLGDPTLLPDLAIVDHACGRSRAHEGSKGQCDECAFHNCSFHTIRPRRRPVAYQSPLRLSDRVDG